MRVGDVEKGLPLTPKRRGGVKISIDNLQGQWTKKRGKVRTWAVSQVLVG